MTDTSFDYQFRLIIIGETGVGKSSLLRCYAEGKFSGTTDPTLGVDFFTRTIKLKDKSRIKLHLWDTAGQERFRTVVKTYYRDAVGVLMVYDVSNRNSFNKLPTWIEEVKNNSRFCPPVLMLVGSKSDLRHMKEAVNVSEANIFAMKNGIKSIVTSSKTGENVELTFKLIAEDIYAKMKDGEYPSDDENWKGIKKRVSKPTRTIHLQPNHERKRSKCC